MGNYIFIRIIVEILDYLLLLCSINIVVLLLSLLYFVRNIFVSIKYSKNTRTSMFTATVVLFTFMLHAI
jgi:hypothetical protein